MRSLIVEATMVNIWESLKAKAAFNRVNEQKLYGIVAKELSDGKRVEGLWLKALADANGETNRAEALYVKSRVQSLKDSMDIYTYEQSKASEKAEFEESLRSRSRKNKTTSSSQSDSEKWDAAESNDGEEFKIAGEIVLFYSVLFFILAFIVLFLALN